MERLAHKRFRLRRRRVRVRQAIRPKTPRARLVVNRSNRNISAQIIDDIKGVTLCAATTSEKSFGGAARNKEAAKRLGELLAKRAVEKGVKQVVLDRRGMIYHGRIAAFAEAAREHGLEF
ncbi:MAG: 50S ribosomal protein L18 [Spirochaetales bacterium]|nr:50S ribosomal protein L18 [Leptospiraceae bacterium]MCP5480120.1 50S ribosomal protein L18 [Spirochaetales bacterium]MCP5485540.1 50S ribosomal protein L18 [Spirochaetales bacterium]